MPGMPRRDLTSQPGTSMLPSSLLQQQAAPSDARLPFVYLNIVASAAIYRGSSVTVTISDFSDEARVVLQLVSSSASAVPVLLHVFPRFNATQNNDTWQWDLPRWGLPLAGTYYLRASEKVRSSRPGREAGRGP